MRLLLLYMMLAVVGGGVVVWRAPQLPRWCPLLVLAALPQLMSIWGLRGLLALALTTVCVALWCWRNRALAGVPLVAVGIGMNLLVMALHQGAMPIDQATLATLGHHAANNTALLGSKDVVATSSLWMLSDWMVFVSPVRTLVASPGDLLVVAGLIWWLCSSRQRKGAVSQ